MPLIPGLIRILLQCVGVAHAAHGCMDDRGRPGSIENINACKSGQPCLLNARIACVLHELPPRPAVGGQWECDEGYGLAGARFSWPGGTLVIEPEKCTPEGGRIGSWAGGELWAGQNSMYGW
jgi:hypothetical protein